VLQFLSSLTEFNEAVPAIVVVFLLPPPAWLVGVIPPSCLVDSAHDQRINPTCPPLGSFLLLFLVPAATLLF
jgi:hypothetical protein